jgi:hypothetical protein
MSLSPIAWIGCICGGKFRRNFIAWTCALIEPVQHVLHRSSCSNEMVRNALKHEFRVQWGRSGVFVAKNSDATSLHELVKSETPQNMSLSPIEWIGRIRCDKFQCDFVARTNALIAPVWSMLHRSMCSNETVWNAPKHKFESNMMDWLHSLRKILT